LPVVESSTDTNEQSSSSKSPSLKSLSSLLKQTKNCDHGRLKKRLLSVKKITDQTKQTKALNTIAKAIAESINAKQVKLTNLPKVTYPQTLPVSQNADVIAETIKNNQVVIIAGETGSGKTTQIPKICLELGRGIDGLIGHTQPRRIAARTVANRIAEELNSQVGDVVGYKVRFTDQVSERSYIKLMTDGILLAEMQKDRLLRQYDTIIIDEAHERSLNIDFILGYLKQILPRRPDLKVIITSATIDPQRFAQHFNEATGKSAPIIEVSGRTFPVALHYRPLLKDKDEEIDNQDVITGILAAVDELSSISYGDILVFLNGEREIRDTAYALEKANLRDTNILPLFSRLTVQEQNRIFAPHRGRNIVLATNVAETSLTVPGIKYVIDPGTARISRYSYRTKVQRLPIEPISQASANQRSGRCGRVSAGLCIRLYSEDDFNNRPEFTDPEILRTNLAMVILQMLALDLGEISAFPFVQPPDNRNINDGIRLLEELAAIDNNQVNGKVKLTKAGRLLAKFPIDPRLAKMLLSAVNSDCASAMIAIVAGLSIQDPRERPMEKQQAADEKHNRFKDKDSDFVSLLNLWTYINQQQQQLSTNQFRRLCQKEFLSYIRIREWQDITSQLKQTLKELKMPLGQNMLLPLASDNSDEQNRTKIKQQQDNLHQAILSGLLSHVGQLDENREYKGARGSRFYIFPGSGIAKKSPKWLMATELVETSRLFARTAAKIDLLWLEPLAKHLTKTNYSEPHWEKKQGAVMAFEQVSLYGLIIVAKRKINFKHIEPQTCREIFIREALVNGDCTLNEAFFQHNKDCVNTIEKMEQKARRKDFLIDEEQLIEFYQQKIPHDIVCLTSFLVWWKKAKQQAAKQLHFSEAFLLKDSAKKLAKNDHPDFWQQGALTLPLSYHFSPGALDDGVSVTIPVGILNQVENNGFDWLIPALRLELIIALIKILPKSLRRNFVPAPNYAEACLAAFAEQKQLQGISLTQALAKQLLRMTGVRLPDDAWASLELPAHLMMNFKVLNEKGKVLQQGRNLEQLKNQLQGKVKQSIKKVADKGIEKTNIIQWNIDDLPIGYEKKVANITIKAFPALVDHNSSVAIELFEQQVLAEQAMLAGLSRLILLNIPSPVKYLQQKLPNKAKLGLYFNPFGSINDLLNDCVNGACRYLLIQMPNLPRNEYGFNKARDHVRAEIADCVLTTAIKLEQALSLGHDIRKKLKGKVNLNVIQAHGDIKNQLEQLIFSGFVTDIGVNRLDDVVRYLKGIVRRLEKLSIDANQDRLKMLEVEKVTEQYKKIVSKTKTKQAVLPTELVELRWMIEELRISLFAQNLGTAYPISVKRLSNKFKEFSL
jgi:ATP-dependent RNA helicase HrpA